MGAIFCSFKLIGDIFCNFKNERGGIFCGFKNNRGRFSRLPKQRGAFLTASKWTGTVFLLDKIGFWKGSSMTKSDFIEHTDPTLDELQLKAESILTTIRNIRNRQEPNPVLDISKYFSTSVHSIAYIDKGLPAYACNREDFSGLVYSLVFRDQLTGKPYRVDTEIGRGNNKKILIGSHGHHCKSTCNGY